MKAQSHVCSNPLCRRTFTKPLKAENLSSGSVVVYKACPYCLAEITIEESAPMVKHKSIAVEETTKSEPKTRHEEPIIIRQPSTETPNCKHYFGYLSERPSRDNLPEECMICPKIVQCMLKGVTG